MHNNFRVILAKKELSITDVSRATGISRTTLNSLFYKRAKGIQFQTLEALCVYLNCDVGELFEITKEAV
ncbi:helix-turn-helix transcriptional regulator [Metasolibacillus sp.]|uniref:helix-turn-helix domain-containing protein n=1 Tax=Metasolibacillus sp. TaxID=2703680 RepID=UPI0025F042DB|nr:helix-turn-helix transcriptional regulator [Metasolibacillus sp.]MCT6924098.1 helix-turn-helix transcriptional regulator [Metasolibacillus sp.]MCT6940205.1 helix-turn-helix transcriptional regulator [Metasolibacillus sp.]